MNEVYGYVRVSSMEQNEERQMIALKGVGVSTGHIFITKDVSGIGRIATLSFTDSTLLGRFLYIKDALGLLLFIVWPGNRYHITKN